MLKPSRIHQLLLLATGVLSGVAILVTPLPAPVQGLCCIALVVWLARCWKLTSLHRVLWHHGGADDTINHWAFVENGTVVTQGRLIPSGYRSAALLVLVLKDEASETIKRIPVWRDSVNPHVFSYLNMQLMFNTRNS